MRYVIRSGRFGATYLYRIVGGQAFKVHRPMDDWPALLGYIPDVVREALVRRSVFGLADTSRSLCWQCWRVAVRAFGVPCHDCRPALLAAYHRERARTGRRWLYLPDDPPNDAPGGRSSRAPNAQGWRDAPGPRGIDAVPPRVVRDGCSAGNSGDGGSAGMASDRTGRERDAGPFSGSAFSFSDA